MKISKNYQLEMFDSDEGGGVNYQMQIVTKLPNENIQNYQLEMFDSGGSVNYQMQIVTKLPNENIQNYQLEIFDSGRGGGEGKLPNANCDQTTKWKYPKLPTRNVLNLEGGKLPNANCDQTTNWKYKKLPTRNVWFWGEEEITKYKLWPNYQMKISKTTN